MHWFDRQHDQNPHTHRNHYIRRCCLPTRGQGAQESRLGGRKGYSIMPPTERMTVDAGAAPSPNAQFANGVCRPDRGKSHHRQGRPNATDRGPFGRNVAAPSISGSVGGGHLAWDHQAQQRACHSRQGEQQLTVAAVRRLVAIAGAGVRLATADAYRGTSPPALMKRPCRPSGPRRCGRDLEWACAGGSSSVPHLFELRVVAPIAENRY